MIERITKDSPGTPPEAVVEMPEVHAVEIPSTNGNADTTQAVLVVHEVGSYANQLKTHLKSSYMYILYVFIPIAFLAKFGGFGPAPIFVTSFIALLPLAAALGELTEDLARHTTEGIGALINVTFGNATELIISIVALFRGEYALIKNALVGSVIGNMLLVLGTAFIYGGLKRKMLSFSTTAAQTYVASLLFACMGFIIPTAFFSLSSDSSDPHFALAISREIAVMMVVMYAGYLFFQLKSHKEMFEGAEEEEEDLKYTFPFGILAIAIAAVLVSVLSDWLVDSVEGAAEGLHLSKYFISLVLIPIVGNIAEHAGAILMAGKGKLDISLGIALGSSIQIGMFVMPLLVLIAWVIGRPLDMNVTPFTCASLFAGIVLTFSVVSGGSANYLVGGKMFGAYLMLVVAFLNAPDLHY